MFWLVNLPGPEGNQLDPIFLLDLGFFKKHEMQVSLSIFGLERIDLAESSIGK